MRGVLFCLGVLAAQAALAFEFVADPVTVTAASDGVFHHLDASGRRSLAGNRGTLALVWEDNASGQPQVRVAFRRQGEAGFSRPVTISGEASAYEPAIVACGPGFLVGWESEDHVWLRFVSPARIDRPVLLSADPARQISLAETPDRSEVAMVWAGQQGHFFQIASGRVTGCGAALKIRHLGLVDASKDKTNQQYPAVAVTRVGTLVAWEDRREGATRIFTAFAPAGQEFLPHQLLNQYKPPPNPAYGRGTGAMRVVLSTDQDQAVMAVWLDKRNFEGGYDVYAAFSADGGRHFGKNELVQDEFGENIPQWHPAGVLLGDGRALVAWDDTRDDTPDIWFTVRSPSGEWSDDENWPGAAGKGAQTAPVLLFDGSALHAAWVERRGQASAIRYLSAE